MRKLDKYASFLRRNPVRAGLTAVVFALIGTSLFLLTRAATTNMVAFPGAEGFGAYAAGGRGGVAIEVTTLTDSGPGSFRACLEDNRPRTCVFRTGGTIAIKKQIRVTNPYLTVAGQTAPGDGITVRSDPSLIATPIIFATHDVVVRHIRFRAGPLNQGLTTSGQQSVQIGGDTDTTYNVIFDHVSASWGIDGQMQTGMAHDVTIQNSIIAEGLNNAGHAKGKHARGLNHYVGAGMIRIVIKSAGSVFTIT